MAKQVENRFELLFEASKKFTQAMGLHDELMLEIFRAKSDWEFIIKINAVLEAAAKTIVKTRPNSGSTEEDEHMSFDGFVDAMGGSDARIIMGDDEARLIRLWREKRGEVEPEDLSQHLIVQLGSITEDLNRTWYERSSGNAIEDIQRRVRHPIHKWMGATLDGRVRQTGAVFEAKFMLPWNFSEEAAAEKHMAQLQHNMWVTNARSAVLSIITGGGKWVEITINGDPLYQHLLLTAEKTFWRCVQSGEPPRLFGIEPPRPRLEAVRVVDMSSSNSWAELAATYRQTRAAHEQHETAKLDLKKLVPEDAKEAMGHGLRAKRSKSGAISFELTEAANATVQ